MSLPTITKMFQTSITMRLPECLPHPIGDFNRAIPLVRQMMYETARTVGVFVLDSEGFLRAPLKPSPFINDGATEISHLEVNMSNVEFDLAKLPAKVLQHCVNMCPLGSAPEWATAVVTVQIPGNIIAGKEWDGATLADTETYVLYALPLGVCFCPGKAHVEGLASSREIQDWLESEYGPHFAK